MLTFLCPRTVNLVIPLQYVISANTGSIICNLLEYNFLYFGVSIFSLICCDRFSLYFNMGIYRAKVTTKNNDLKKLFRLDKEGGKHIYSFYNHRELNFARELGLHVEITYDCEDNYLKYERDDCITGSQLFKEFTNKLYKIRTEHPELKHRIKQYISTIYSKLYAYERRTVIGDVYDTKEIVDAVFNEIGEMIGSKCKLNDGPMYHTNFARIKAFVTAEARIWMAKVMKPHIEHIHACKTDGFISDVPLELDVGDNIGQFKLEEHGNVTIKNAMSIIWE